MGRGVVPPDPSIPVAGQTTRIKDRSLVLWARSMIDPNMICRSTMKGASGQTPSAALRNITALSVLCSDDLLRGLRGARSAS